MNELIIAPFGLEHLQLKKDRAWRFRILVKAPVPLVFRHLAVRLSLNEEPFEEQIHDYEVRKQEIEGESSLFPDDKKGQLKECDNGIAAVKKALKKAQAEHPTLEFESSVEEMKYTDKNFTLLTMIVAEADIFPLIENHARFRSYKVEIEKSNA